MLSLLASRTLSPTAEIFTEQPVANYMHQVNVRHLAGDESGALSLVDGTTSSYPSDPEEKGFN